MKTRLGCVAAALLASGWVSSAATLTLEDCAVNVNGVTTFLTGGKAPPSGVVSSNFDLTIGLGSVSIRVANAQAKPVTNYVGMLVDHEIDQTVNTFFNEFGGAIGSPVPGQSWEISELGYRGGTLYNHFLAGKLASGNAVPSNSPDDVALALAWNFTSQPGEVRVVEMSVGESVPATGFYLTHTDPLSKRTLYFSSTIRLASDDVEPPKITCPPNLALQADPGQCSRRGVTYTVTATDNRPGVTAVCVPPSGSTFPVGTNTVVCTATDASGNTSQCRFTVAVRGEPPVILTPANIVRECAPPSGLRVDYDVSATSPCGLPVTVLCVPPSGSVFPLGATTVNCTGVDAAGSLSERTFAVLLVGTNCAGFFGLEKSTCLAGEVHADPLLHPYPCGTCVELTGAPAEGWKFLGWLGDARSTENPVTITMTQRKCVEAVFGTELSVGNTTNGTAWIDPLTDLYPCASVVRFLARPDAGYYLSHWTNALRGTATAVDFRVETTNAIATPVFRPLPSGQFALTVATRGYGRVTGQPSRLQSYYPAGSNVVVRAVPDAGQEFQGWSFEAGPGTSAVLLTNNPTTVVVSSNRFVTAQFSWRPWIEIVRCQGELDEHLFRIQVHGRLRDTFAIETSSRIDDTNAWVEVARELNVLGAVQYEDPYVPDVIQRYYRARVVGETPTNIVPPQILIRSVAGGLEVYFPGQSGVTYHLESTQGLQHPSWETIGSRDGNSADVVFGPFPGTDRTRFFRVRAE